jgi:hypothetical protein
MSKQQHPRHCRTEVASIIEICLAHLLLDFATPLGRRISRLLLSYKGVRNLAK